MVCPHCQHDDRDGEIWERKKFYRLKLSMEREEDRYSGADVYGCPVCKIVFIQTDFF